MTADDALSLINTLEALGVRCWVDGGWGVDALLGSQHRDHDDLDLVVCLDDLDAIVGTLTGLGFTVAVDARPTRLAMSHVDGRQVDFHPVRFDETGTGWQAKANPDGTDCPYPPSGFTTGTIGGVEVGCLTAKLQIVHHQGYAPQDKDRHDLDLLGDLLG